MTDVMISQNHEPVELSPAAEQVVREHTERAREGRLRLTGEAGGAQRGAGPGFQRRPEIRCRKVTAADRAAVINDFPVGKGLTRREVAAHLAGVHLAEVSTRELRLRRLPQRGTQVTAEKRESNSTANLTDPPLD